ncbi:hypothetical protein SYNPS1DRAFT_23369 [Syncephalis pseudoplumigaleata]|uniref:Plasma membrane fusion protein PRM1 n=1 Tax=Syncephalis pseudoplumigaleata TaxID=1712513 RepID=A0A4P9YYV5_9FUNG|nr:hypothetical protein SYNPS1DRAFT_23369 [Syncephalis pseudoplumigaleata]|eukprot:RKP24561.1 hypothetical protein SYNPS1DRAFT_23369 [Syncephalis pseudoplumigaleata]
MFSSSACRMDISILCVAAATIVVNAYRDELVALENNVLCRPNAQLTKDLHLLTGELNQFKHTFLPTLALIRNLRDNTLVDGADWHISNLARVYLGDIQDHCTVINDALADLITLADNLINLAMYGTNFVVFPELTHRDGIMYFWKLCGIVTALVVAIFAFGFYWMNRRSKRYRPGMEISRQLREPRCY